MHGVENIFISWSSIISGLAGGCIAGFFSILAVRIAHKNDLEKEKENQENIISGLLQALHDEIETLWARYFETIGEKLEALEENQPFLFYYPVFQDYFTVYTGNSYLIGQIKDNDSRKAIVTTYTKAKGFVDSFRHNNDLLQKREHWTIVFAETDNPKHETIASAYLQSLVLYAKALKDAHKDLKINIDSLLRSLRKNGAYYSNPPSQVDT